MKRIHYEFLPALVLPLIVGGISALLTRTDMQVYSTLAKPPLSPPAIVFPIAWTVLYLMMGTAFYLMLSTDSSFRLKATAGSIFIIQLFMNFFWSIIFFHMGMYTAAFLWLTLMFVLIVNCTILFFLIDRRAGWLMIPYNLWMAFAGYLNLSIVLMNP